MVNFFQALSATIAMCYTDTNEKLCFICVKDDEIIFHGL